MNRWLRPPGPARFDRAGRGHPTGLMNAGAVRYMSVHIWKQLDSMDTAGHRNAPSNSPGGRETQLTGRFRRWWQVSGSNQRRRRWLKL